MRELTIALLLAACSDGHRLIIREGLDGPPSDATPPCKPLAQTGCNTGEKCTWIFTTASTGRVGCAPDGINTIGTSCTRMPLGPSGYDDCVHGSYCVGAAVGGAGTCAAICDLAGGAPICVSTMTCAAQSPLFGTPPAAGLCD